MQRSGQASCGRRPCHSPPIATSRRRPDSRGQKPPRGLPPLAPEIPVADRSHNCAWPQTYARLRRFRYRRERDSRRRAEKFLRRRAGEAAVQPRTEGRSARVPSWATQVPQVRKHLSPRLQVQRLQAQLACPAKAVRPGAGPPQRQRRLRAQGHSSRRVRPPAAPRVRRNHGRRLKRRTGLAVAS